MLHGIVTSDWHLGGMTKIFANPTEKQMVEIHKPYQYAIEHSIEHLFMPGDVADTASLSEHDLLALVKLLLTYDEHVTTYLILGNHDIESIKKTSMDILKVMSESGMFKRFKIFFKPELKRIEGINVCFMPFPHTKVLEATKPPLVFAHIETVGALGDNGRPLKASTHEGNEFERQPGDFIFSGHLHQQQYLKNKRISYGGSLYQKNFGEAMPKGFLDFTAKYVQGKLVVTQEVINSHPNFTLETVLIQASKDWDALSKDPNIRYKILIGEGVVVPRDITTNFPNIVYLNGASSRTKVNMDGTIDNGSQTLKDLPTFSLTTGLSKYLREAELNPRQIKRAKQWVKEARESVRI